MPSNEVSFLIWALGNGEPLVEEEMECRSSEPCLENPVRRGVGAFLLLEESLPAPSWGPDTVRLWNGRTGDTDRSMDAGRGKEIPLRYPFVRPREADNRLKRGWYSSISPFPHSLKLRFLEMCGLSLRGRDVSR